jgi:phosphatidylserine decarboxylase
MTRTVELNTPTQLYLDSTPDPPGPVRSDSQMTPTISSLDKPPVLKEKARSPSFTKKFNLRRPSSKRSASVDSSMISMTLPASPSTPNMGGVPTPSVSSGTVTPPARPSAAKSRFRKSWGPKNTDYSFAASNDIIGIVMLEIKGATDLPKVKNSKHRWKPTFG